MTDADQLQIRRDRKANIRFLVLTVIASLTTIGIKTYLALGIPASAMFSDDYAYLNKSIYYISGDWAMTGFCFHSVFAGILYPLAVSPWMLFDQPETRIFVVFVINAVFSGIAVCFGSLAVRRVAKTETSLLTPIVIGTFIPMFLFSFVAMTENLVYPLLAICAWFCADFRRTLTRSSSLVAMLICVAALPLVRAPGLAAGLAIFLMCLRAMGLVGWKRAICCAGLVITATVVPYVAMSIAAPDVGDTPGMKREAAYLGGIANIVASPRNWWTISVITANQLKYILLATGVFAIPVTISLFLGRHRKSAESGTKRSQLFIFALLCGLGMLAMAELHIIRKIHFDFSKSDFLFGRYNDPVAFLALISGLAALPLISHVRLNAMGHFLLRVLAPLLLVYSLARVWNDGDLATINQTALAGFCKKPNYPVWAVALAITSITLTFQLSPRRRWFGLCVMLITIAWNALGINRGLETYIKPRARLIAKSQEAATWLANETPPDVGVAFDRYMLSQSAPTWRTMDLHYKALVFAMHPRRFAIVCDNETLQSFDYLFTATTRQARVNLPVAWTNDDYIIYKVVPNAKVYKRRTKSPKPDAANSRPAKSRRPKRNPPSATKSHAELKEKLDVRDLIQTCCPADISFDSCQVKPHKIASAAGRLTMAWTNSTVTTPVCLLGQGNYELLIRARADACEDDPALLLITAGSDFTYELKIGPGDPTCYSIPFGVPENGKMEFTLRFTNNGLCGPEGAQTDKNIIIESLMIIPILDSDRS